ncbi:MAG TPA: hypothetical protein PLO61_09690 [Fimbriimonadaceae bacterium]|nr:hypothetical protein [Fimbriimonadaceae bacterium]HRJ32902.1 hypothetical protein [Fimbriimonadaceae bacterium]
MANPYKAPFQLWAILGSIALIVAVVNLIVSRIAEGPPPPDSANIGLGIVALSLIPCGVAAYYFFLMKAHSSN